MMQSMQGFEISLNDTIKLSFGSPLDSMGNYPINPASQQHQETGKRESLSRKTLILRIPLELDDENIDRFKIERLFSLYLLDEVLRIAPV
jgi:hypothetical protein